MTDWFRANPVLTWFLIFVLMSFVYNRVFRTRKLPILKAAVVYILLALFSVVLLDFQLFGLPIVPSMSVAVLLMFMVRIRYFVEGRSSRKPEQ
ncbi:YlaH-like family protein [Paenibacillus sp. S-38]|uniref:YlaH-like family protein n=1 Tax=Paenibacillus sp. S-38 TaxID=3416710 RepID=UPI003CF3A790